MLSHPNRPILLTLLLPALALAQPTDDAPRMPGPVTATQQRPAVGRPSPAAPRIHPSQDAPFPLGARLVGETVGGALIGASGLAVTFLGGVLVSDQVSCGYSECRSGRNLSLISASIGMGLGAASGVYLGGSLMDARGGFLPTLLGGLVGTAAPLAVVALSDEASWAVLTATFAVPVATSILAFELSHGAYERRRQQERPVVMVPTVSLAPGGGALGLAGRF
ncbi:MULTISPECIES: hypothetical protein [Myxococcus]|nr:MULTISPECIES: hypothetical protein [Myxococcus]QZZ53587.1 hypothetical protein MyxoNM_30645 [Myxococcus xanthus]UYI13258.1 hypothetical protein N3T43_30000 [Myxococcus xanthus]UYI20624.1 hypothetical protein N1129_30450 [Myxococcus xanthus]SDX87818.1 hypothetical protein SAMN05444383_11455 [Myxococcus xanthus]